MWFASWETLWDPSEIRSFVGSLASFVRARMSRTAAAYLLYCFQELVCRCLRERTNSSRLIDSIELVCIFRPSCIREGKVDPEKFVLNFRSFIPKCGQLTLLSSSAFLRSFMQSFASSSGSLELPSDSFWRFSVVLSRSPWGDSLVKFVLQIHKLSIGSN